MLDMILGCLKMGGGRVCCRLRPDETVRGQPNSRRHPQAGIQDTPDQARDVRVIRLRGDAFCFGLVARAETGLISASQ